MQHQVHLGHHMQAVFERTALPYIQVNQQKKGLKYDWASMKGAIAKFTIVIWTMTNITR